LFQRYSTVEEKQDIIAGTNYWQSIKVASSIQQAWQRFQKSYQTNKYILAYTNVPGCHTPECRPFQLLNLMLLEMLKITRKLD